LDGIEQTLEFFFWYFSNDLGGFAVAVTGSPLPVPEAPVRGLLGHQLRFLSGEVVGGAVDRAVGGAVGRAVGKAVGEAVGGAVGEAVGRAVGEAVRRAGGVVPGANSRVFLGLCDSERRLLLWP
jgi:hypothetical protein